MHNTLKLTTLFMVAILVGCGAAIPTIDPFKMDIQQGNVVTSEMLLKLRPGMTKSQVQYILGTPLLVDSFHSDRWDYFYQLRKQGKIVNQRRVILDFDGDSLAKVRGDVVPEGTDIDALVQEAKSETEQKANDNTGAAQVEPMADELLDAVPELVAEPVTPLPEVVDATAEVAEEVVAEQETVTVEPMKDELLDAVPEVVAEPVTPLPEVVDAAVEESAVTAPVQEAVNQVVDEVPQIESQPLSEAVDEVKAPVVEAAEAVVEAVEAEVEVAPEVDAPLPTTKPAKMQIPAPPVVGTASKKMLKPTKRTMIPAPPVMGPVAKSAKKKPVPMKALPVVELEVKMPEPEVVEVKADEVMEQVVEVVEEEVVVDVPTEVKAPVMPAPKSPLPASTFPADKAVFRLERNLDTSRVKKAVPKTEVLPEVKSKANEVKSKAKAMSDELPYEEEPGFFERTLETIGF